MDTREEHASAPLEMKLQMATMWMLGLELGSSARAASALTSGDVIASALSCLFTHKEIYFL